MAPAAAALATDPVVDFRIAAGDGSWSDRAVVSAGGDVEVTLAPQHWLHIASGGATRVPYRQLEVAFCAAAFVEPSAAAGKLAAGGALSPVRMAGVLRAAISAGLSFESTEGVAAALRRLVAFARSKRPSACHHQPQPTRG